MRASWIPVATVAALTLAGCGGDSDPASTGSAEGRSVAYVAATASSPDQQLIDRGLEAGAAEAGWQVKVFDAHLSPDQQVAHVDTAIAQGRAAIGSWTLDPGATAGAYQRAREAGIPIIGDNSAGEGVSSTVWWEVNVCGPNSPLERNAAYIAERRPKARVMVIGGPPVPSITQNVTCFTDAAKAAGLEIVTRVDNSKDTSSAAAQLTADQLTKHRDIDAIWAFNDQSALGASAAITQARMAVASGEADSKGVMIFGINGEPDAIAAVRDQRLTGSWDANAVAAGWAIIKAMQTAVEAPDDKHPDLTVQSVLWTSENIADYVEPAQRKYALDDLPLVEDDRGDDATR